MVNATVAKLLNTQVGAELYASTLYLQMAAWCEQEGLGGASQFFQQHATEELAHRERIIGYLFECDVPLVLGAIDAPPAEFGSLRDALEAAYVHEQKVTGMINEIAGAAMEARDFATFSFIQWFIDEQREEEALLRGVLGDASLAASTGKGEGLWHLNQHLGSLAGGEAAAPTA